LDSKAVTIRWSREEIKEWVRISQQNEGAKQVIRKKTAR